MRQEMMGFWDAVASAGPYANNLTSLQTDNHANTPSLMPNQQWREALKDKDRQYKPCNDGSKKQR